MTSERTFFFRSSTLSILTLAGLVLASPAAAAPNCAGGSMLRDVAAGNAWIGCVFPGNSWDGGQLSMCNGTELVPSSPDATCHVCVDASHLTNVTSGNWGNLSSSDLTCAGCVAQPSGLVGWMDMDEIWKYDIPDYDWDIYGTPYGVPTPIDGHVLRALSFDGNDYVEVGDSPAINFGAAGPSGNFTFATWVRVASNPAGSVRVMLDKRQPVGSGYRGYHAFLYSGRPGLQLADASGYSNYIATPAVSPDNLWHFVAIAVDRTAGARFYIDNQLVGTISVAGRPGSLVNSSPLRLGMRSFQASGGFVGGMDEPMLFNRALDSGEIQSLVQAGVYGICRPAA